MCCVFIVQFKGQPGWNKHVRKDHEAVQVEMNILWFGIFWIWLDRNVVHDLLGTTFIEDHISAAHSNGPHKLWCLNGSRWRMKYRSYVQLQFQGSHSSSIFSYNNEILGQIFTSKMVFFTMKYNEGLFLQMPFPTQCQLHSFLFFLLSKSLFPSHSLFLYLAPLVNTSSLDLHYNSRLYHRVTDFRGSWEPWCGMICLRLNWDPRLDVGGTIVEISNTCTIFTWILNFMTSW